MSKKIAFVFGTRPEIIKLAPIIWECEKNDIPFVLIHCGQHYSQDMEGVFFEKLSLPDPKYKFSIGNQNLHGHGMQTGTLLMKVEEVLRVESPDVVVVQGDTNSVLAGALAAVKMPVREDGSRCSVAHVEAGLRSYDRTMPEEINRIIVDHISDVLFAPTEIQKNILLKEGIDQKKIFVVGNTIVDTVHEVSRSVVSENKVLAKHNLKSGGYILLTLHRQENVDYKETLSGILDGIRLVSEHASLPVILPIHPRTANKLKEFDLSLPENVMLMPPVDYHECIELEKNSSIILTDSGGIQEEACILNIPCVTLRTTTERPETVNVGANYIAGVIAEDIFSAYLKMKAVDKDWQQPFGDGRSGESILKILLDS